MKLIQLNTLSGAFNKIYRFMKTQDADLLHLQEVTSSPTEFSSFFDFLENTKAVLPKHHVFFSPALDIDHAGFKVYFGNAILSKTALTAHDPVFTQGHYTESFKAGSDRSFNIKLFQHAITTTPSGQSLHLLNYHGYNAKGTEKQGNELTKKHCQCLADYIGHLSGPLILSGDFNLAPDSASLTPINNILRNLCIENGVETTRNEQANSMIPVDYIWVSNEITVNRFEVLPDLVSDHAALLLEFDV